MRYSQLFSYASRLRTLGNEIILAGLRRHGVVGIVPSHGDILHILLHDGSCTMSELARRIGRTRSTVTALVRKLEQAGYVQQLTDTSDGRGRRVLLTPQGRALQPVFAQISADLAALVSRRLTDDEAAQLERLLAKCLQSPDAGDAPQPSPAAAHTTSPTQGRVFMSNYRTTHIDLQASRTELHDLLQLTGCEVSCNTLPKGASIPFVHAHKHNEELYIILDGAGTLFVDGQEMPISKGDCIRIDPAGMRCLCASPEQALHYLCIQTKAGSLEGYTMTDGLMPADAAKPSWL